MQIHITISPPGPPPPIIPPEVRGKLWVIRHDFNCDDQNFTPYLPRVCELKNGQPVPKLVGGAPYGLPETEKLFISDYIEMDKAFQEFWFALLRHACPSTWTEIQVKSAWANLTHGARAFTNKRGWNNGYQDYINGVNVGAVGMMKENVTCCGAVVLEAGAPFLKGGEEVLPIVTLDAYHLPAVADVIDKPWFIHAATSCRPERVDPTPRPEMPYGTFVVNPFPQAGGNDVPVPLVTKGGINYIVTRRLRKLADGEAIPSPYVR
jgi:hypothetical protein